MKAVINGIEFEGTPQEFSEFISSQNKAHSQQDASVKLEKNTNNKEQEKSVQSLKEENYFSGTEEFLSALFRYRPSNTSMGREAYVVKLLATGKPYTIKQLARLGNTNFSTIKLALKRAVDAGCIINATGIQKGSFSVIDSLKDTSKVHMVSLGSIDQARTARKEHEQKNSAYVASKANSSQQIDTGSAPITKIKYTEGS